MPPSMRELATRTHNDTDTQAQSNTEAINEVITHKKHNGEANDDEIMVT